MSKKEVLFDGWMYDVSTFVKRHPGGSVIEYYTKKGEDATIPILQFHNRSIKHVKMVMNTLSKRPATLEDYNMTPEKKARHDQMTEEFIKLFREVEAEGLFKPTYWYHIAVVLEVFIWLVLGTYFIRNFDAYSVRAIGIFVIGIGLGRVGLIQHEGSHNSLTGIPKVDKFVENIVMGVFMGMSSKHWIKSHSRHHAMPQRPGYDNDMNRLPFFALYEEGITDPKSIFQNNWFLRNQFFVMMPFTLGTYFPLFSLVLFPKWSLKYGYYEEFVTVMMHYCIGIPILGVWPFFLAKFVMGCYLLNNFNLNHSHMPIVKEPLHWLEYATLATSNITESAFNNWWTILINYQIEHHFFPTMPQRNLRYVVARSKALAEKFNLPYKVLTLFESQKEFMKQIYKVMLHVRNVAKKNI